MDFTNLLSGIGNVIKIVNSSTAYSDDLDESLEILTSEDYAAVYSTYNTVTDDTILDVSPNIDIIPTDGNATATGLTDYYSWDPRLARVDGFIATDSSSGNPTIVPFASATAAGAFYDLVFTIEKAVADKMKQEGIIENSDVIGTANTASLGDRKNMYEDDISGSEKVYVGNSSLLDTIKSKSDSFGVASIVNPYTLTKLCGGLVKTGDDKDASFENHMYDIRDLRRFYDKSVTTNNDFLSITNPTTTNIITYSNKDIWGRTPYYFQDFVFCKWWNVIPNNRLITLRKYHAPVYDNLQFSNMFTLEKNLNVLPFAPIATVVTYFGDDTGNTLSSIFSFTAGTKWKDISADVHQVTGDTGSDSRAVIDNMFSGGGGFTGAESNFLKSVQGAGNLLTSKIFSFGKFIGLLSPDGYSLSNDQAAFDNLSLANIDPSDLLYSNKIIGPVNRILSTKARDAGIVFDQKLTITCQYVARPIGGVNTKAAMLDILSNCMEIASVDAAFWGGGYHFNIHPQLYPFKNNAFKNRIMDDLYAGRIFGKNGALAHTVEGMRQFGSNGTGSFDWSNVSATLGNVLGLTLGAIGEMLNSISNTIFGGSSSLGDWLKGAGNNVGDGNSGDEGAKKMNSLFSNLNNMWRSLVIQQSVMPSINGMKAILTGEPVGNWHLTVGNPLNPIMVIGNLICTDMKVESGEVLGPDDFPLEIKVTYTLEHAMARDKSGIQSMFNRGNGRIYLLPDWIRASSDYESKVDNYTGPGDGSGWYTPKYMDAGKMQAMGGTGFKTYKISPPKELSVNAHTDGTVIAKFTPPNVDAAISNIKSGSTSFFGANSASRAYIRGIAATRKLMN